MVTGISSDNERFLDQAVAKGQFASREEAIDEAIRRLRDDVSPTPDKEIPRTTAEKAAAFLRWADSHGHVTAVADDSRESIYQGCGE
jgi:Arc/MetJ-type ribon-helix-helix transcriptional regulator